MPPKDYLPESLEEKIVCYVDKLFVYTYDELDHITGWQDVEDCSTEVEKIRKRLGGGQLAPDRLLALEKELKQLINL